MRMIKSLDIDDAAILIAGARAKATEIGVPMCIAITDEAGNLVLKTPKGPVHIPAADVYF